MQNYTAVVLSAGVGSRMHSDIPKQYMDLDGYPVIYYALRAFEESGVDSIVLVTAPEMIEYCGKIWLSQGDGYRWWWSGAISVCI